MLMFTKKKKKKTASNHSNVMNGTLFIANKHDSLLETCCDMVWQYWTSIHGLYYSRSHQSLAPGSKLALGKVLHGVTLLSTYSFYIDCLIMFYFKFTFHM